MGYVQPAQCHIEPVLTGTMLHRAGRRRSALVSVWRERRVVAAGDGLCDGAARLRADEGRRGARGGAELGAARS